MNYFKNPYIKFSLKLLFTIVLLTIVFKNVPFNEVLSAVGNTHIEWILAGIIFFILSKYFSAIRLTHFFKNSNSEIDTVYNFKLYLLGMFYNFFLPTGVGGDAYKVIKIHNDYSYSYKNVASTVLLDRISGLVALINIALLLSLYYTSPLQRIILILILLIGNVSYQFIVRKYIPQQRISLKTESLSFLVQFAQCICAYCIFKSIDISTNEILYIIVFLISSIASMFPLSIGGLGAREYTFMLAATYFQLDTEKSIAIGFIFYILSLLVSLFGSYFIFKPISITKKYA